MRSSILLLAQILILIGSRAAAQEPMPGNTRNPSLWLSPNALTEPAHYTLNSQLSGQVELSVSGAGAQTTTLNFHRIPNLELNDARWLVNDSVAPAGSSMFMVINQPISTEEQLLWALDVADTTRFVLTTTRAADLLTGMHLYSEPAAVSSAKLITHTQRSDTTILGTSYVRFGHAGPTPSVPVDRFEGGVPELLFYDRVLSPKERSRISSYLSIKYGLTLQGTDYVASDNSRVWVDRTNAAFGQHMFAVARDSASLLDQRQSTSALEEGFLVLGVDTLTTWHHEHPARIPDGHYLVTGDDGKTRTWKPREPGQPQFTARTWHMQRTGSSLLNTRMRLNAAMMLNAPEKADNCWLVIDRSGTGTFGPGGTVFVQAVPGPVEGTVDLNGVIWDVDGTGSDRYRFAAGGSFIPITWVNAPNCDPPSPGSLTVQAPGGEAPIIARLQGVGHDALVEVEVAADTVTTIPLEAGEYDLTLSDNTGYVIQDRIWIQPKDAPQIPLASQYELTAQEPLVIDATVPGAFNTYEWRRNDDVLATTARLVVERPGEYTCTAIADGCPTRAHTVVTAKVPETGIDLGVMPNPSFGGDFVIQVTLRETMDAQLTIASLQGALVRQRMLRGQDFHRIHEHIGDAGEYIISVRTDDGQRFTRVIVL